MKSLLNLLLIFVVVQLGSTQNWNNYHSLDSQVQTHVDKAVHQANKQFKNLNQHINFYSLDGNPDISRNYYIRVKLRTTVCALADSESGYKQRIECGFNQKGPLIDCVVCKNKNGGELIDCAKHRDISKRKEIRAACHSYLPGGAVPMFVATWRNEENIACPGCV